MAALPKAWYAWRDSNPHDISITSPSNWSVYHSTTGAYFLESEVPKFPCLIPINKIKIFGYYNFKIRTLSYRHFSRRLNQGNRNPLVRMVGLEPTHLSALDPKSSASTIPPHPHIELLGQPTAHLLIAGIFAFPISHFAYRYFTGLASTGMRAFF